MKSMMATVTVSAARAMDADTMPASNDAATAENDRVCPWSTPHEALTCAR
jgi:hypothetical protein